MYLTPENVPTTREAITGIITMFFFNNSEIFINHKSYLFKFLILRVCKVYYKDSLQEKDIP